MISVIMTTFNCEKYVQQAIKSIVNQTYADWELIIVDDASTDGTVGQIGKSFMNHLRVVKLTKNVGHTKSLNIALKEAKGDIIAWMDADDISAPERFAEQLKCIEAGADIVTTHGIAINENGKRIKDAYTDNFQRRTQLEINLHLETDCWIMMPSMMFKREVVEKIGDFDEECYYAQDLNYFKRALDAGFRWDKCEMELLKLRRHKGSVRKNKKARERNWHVFALERAKLHPYAEL